MERARDATLVPREKGPGNPVGLIKPRPLTARRPAWQLLTRRSRRSTSTDLDESGSRLDLDQPRQDDNASSTDHSLPRPPSPFRRPSSVPYRSVIERAPDSVSGSLGLFRSSFRPPCNARAVTGWVDAALVGVLERLSMLWLTLMPDDRLWCTLAKPRALWSTNVTSPSSIPNASLRDHPLELRERSSFV